ncbi:MAG: response regulator [Isosphaeraceae bacterium]
MAKVLLVHDDEETLWAIRRAVVRAGYADSEVVEAIDEASALEAIGTQRFDVAVVDISLTPGEPTTEGLDIIEQLRKRQTSCRILGLTTKYPEIGAEVLDRGGDDFIFTEWATINYLELLGNKLKIWRKARPRTPLAV